MSTALVYGVKPVLGAWLRHGVQPIHGAWCQPGHPRPVVYHFRRDVKSPLIRFAHRSSPSHAFLGVSFEPEIAQPAISGRLSLCYSPAEVEYLEVV